MDLTDFDVGQLKIICGVDDNLWGISWEKQRGNVGMGNSLTTHGE